MQVRGTFPELNAGLKKSAKPKLSVGKKSWKRGIPEVPDSRSSSFGVSGRGPRRINAPKTFAGRRAAAHAKAYPTRDVD